MSRRTNETKSIGRADWPNIDALADTGASCIKLRVFYDVDIREFVILASLHSRGVADAAILADVTGLSVTSTESCLQRLHENGLIRRDETYGAAYAASADGIGLIRKSRG